MTTIRQIISDAYEESRLIPLGGTPEADEFAKGFRQYKRILRSLFGNEFSEPYENIPFGRGTSVAHGEIWDKTQYITATFVPDNSRLVCNLDQAYTVYLDPNPRPGARLSIVGDFNVFNLTINANGRKIVGAGTAVLNTAGTSKDYFYNDVTCNWVSIELTNDIAIDSDSSPFPEEFDDLLITMLAMRLSPTFGKQMSQESLSALSRAKSQFRARYRQHKEMPAEKGLWPHLWWSYFQNGFNRGTP